MRDNNVWQIVAITVGMYMYVTFLESGIIMLLYSRHQLLVYSINSHWVTTVFSQSYLHNIPL